MCRKVEGEVYQLARMSEDLRYWVTIYRWPILHPRAPFELSKIGEEGDQPGGFLGLQ